MLTSLISKIKNFCFQNQPGRSGKLGGACGGKGNGKGSEVLIPQLMLPKANTLPGALQLRIVDELKGTDEEAKLETGLRELTMMSSEWKKNDLMFLLSYWQQAGGDTTTNDLLMIANQLKCAQLVAIIKGYLNETREHTIYT